MAIVVSACSFGTGFEDFPRLTFSGFKKRKPNRVETLTHVHKSRRSSFINKHEWGNTSETSSPALKRARSITGETFLSTKRMAINLPYSASSPSLYKLKTWSENSQTALLSMDSLSCDLSDDCSSDTKRSSHCHSESCLKCHVIHKVTMDTSRPKISILNSHSSMQCGTDIKTWYVKVNVSNAAEEDDIIVSIENNQVKIKVKYGLKPSPMERLFGAKRQTVKKNLRFLGILDPATLKTNLDKEGHLVLHFSELVL